MEMSLHAQTRSQQRAIPPMVIDLLAQFGKSEPAGDGASLVYFDKSARRKVKAYAGPLAGILESHLDVFAIFAADEKLVTVGHRYERIRRH